jgi:hypothetical protein
MRIHSLATLTLAVGMIVVVHQPLFGQTAPRPYGPSAQGAANRTPARSVLSSQSAATRPEQARAAQGQNAPAASAQSDRIVQEIRSMEQGLEQANRLLQQRLAQADQVRQQGLKKQDQQLLQRAEQMDRQAIAAYEQQLKQFETFSQRIEQTSQTRAQQAAARANGTQPPAQVRTPANGINGINRAPDANARQPNNGARQEAAPRGLFRFGGR